LYLPLAISPVAINLTERQSQQPATIGRLLVRFN
jgi:hypothetical protein